MVDADQGEQAALPKIVSNAYRQAGGSYPIVIFTDPGLTKVYGTYTHAKLKGQDYGSIFRDLKRSVREAIKDGSFSTELAGDGAVSGDNADVPDSDPIGIVTIENGEMREWSSAAGTTIVAKLLSVEGEDLFVFEAENGRNIRTTSEKLSPQSVKEARELAGL